MTDPTGQISDLTRRIALLEDREALRGVLVRGWRALDYKDWDGWIRNWTDDAQFDFGPWGVLDGKQSIRDKVVASEEPYAAMMHQLLNMQFEVDGDSATGIGFMWFVGIADKDKPSEIISLGGPCEWEFRRETDGSKISRIRLTTWWQQGEDTTNAFR